jgi:hypothetical protein
MKVKVVVDLDMKTGEYEIQFFLQDKDEKQIDQKELARLLEKVVTSWKNKYTN